MPKLSNSIVHGMLELRTQNPAPNKSTKEKSCERVKPHANMNQVQKTVVPQGSKIQTEPTSACITSTLFQYMTSASLSTSTSASELRSGVMIS